MDGRVRIARRGIWTVTMMVCVGYIMMWMAMPTAVYLTTWLPKLRSQLNSTYFSSQGTNLLIYTFPVLFVAVAGSLYLHLGAKLPYSEPDREAAKKNRLGRWRRPLMVRGPLGIVSGIELAFFSMFIALLVWSFSTYLHFFFSKISPSQIEDDGGTLWKAKLDRAALSLGILGNVCLSFLFFPVTRGSSVLPLFGLTSEGSIKYHVWLGHLVMLLFAAHGVSYLLLWALTGRLWEVLKWQHVGVANIPGELSLLVGLCLWATTFPSIRRRFFELFFYTHYLYILFVFFFFLHIGISYACIMLPGFYLFMIDRYLRFLQSRSRVCLISARVLPCETLELNFSKSPDLNYTPTSLLFINVPSISKLQWHPFTISSSSSLEQETVSVVVKAEGSWTRKLYEMVAFSPADRLEVSIEGPYGPTSTHFLRHDLLVMVSGGSGITPFFSIIRELIYGKTTLKWKIPKLLVICAFKKSSDLTMLDLLLPISDIPSNLSDFDLHIEAYVTRERELRTEDLKPMRAVWFKPSASDLRFGSKKEIQLQRSKLQTPTKNLQQTPMSRESQFYNPNTELESLPHRSLVESTNVHYGERPDLKRLLFDCKGSSIGILVSGPKKMRHEVAAICSSGLADNLQFESISFTW
ncbi:hypothetical protein Nepgr_019110 [Nepenthes gracilis]|uniref:ferric-chelate reductase (NADH) n=1 Tax=Nepenthes gracilis TaxID=150966 RepID=A0AAD3SV98_NEPGR|nr:hypothetical protein Nepgr_019110 [Nepenthes gracilis]